MGQQQLLLLVLGFIVVGIAVAVSVVLFNVQERENRRDIISSESVNIGQLALKYYKTPKTYGGGQNSFIGWDIPIKMKMTEYGTYNAVIDSSKVEIFGTENETPSGEQPLKVKTTVFGNDISTEVLN